MENMSECRDLMDQLTSGQLEWAKMADEFDVVSLVPLWSQWNPSLRPSFILGEWFISKDLYENNYERTDCNESGLKKGRSFFWVVFHWDYLVVIKVELGSYCSGFSVESNISHWCNSHTSIQ